MNVSPPSAFTEPGSSCLHTFTGAVCGAFTNSTLTSPPLGIGLEKNGTLIVALFPLELTSRLVAPWLAAVTDCSPNPSTSCSVIA